MPRPVRLIVLRKRAGITLSVSMFCIGIGAATPVRVVNLSISLCSELADVGEAAGDCGGGGHRRRDKVCAATDALPALEIAVRGAGGTLAGRQLVRVHAEAHRTARI